MGNKYGKGTWAMVTGSSDGIGAEYARQLARQGFNIVLVSRTMTKMEKVAAELKQLNPAVQTKIVQVDFCDPNATSVDFYKSKVIE